MPNGKGHSFIRTLVNGVEIDQIPIDDRGLNYGDGLFETIAVRNGKPELLDAHLKRLKLGCDRLQISTSESNLREEIQILVDRQSSAVLKIIVTRGSGGRGYRIPEITSSRRILSLSSYPEYPDPTIHGAEVWFCDTRLSNQPLLSGLKHLNRLEQILARNESKGVDRDEGLMSNEEGDVIEGTMSNLFYIKDGALFTPRLERCGVAGVMRSKVLGIAKNLNITTHIKNITKEELPGMDELFLTNSLFRIWPIGRLDNYSFNIGPITSRLMSALSVLLAERVSE